MREFIWDFYLGLCAELTHHRSRHPENMDEMEEDEDESEAGPPPDVPQIPERFRNGGR